LCPITEANLGDGIFPARQFRDRGGRLGIGSDSNVLIDMTEELRLLEYSQRLADRARNRLAGSAGASTGESIFVAAVEGGNHVLGCAGGIAVGCPADIVSIDRGHASLFDKPTAQILDAFIFGAGRTAVDCVWRAGEKLVQAGVHRDRQRITERYKRTHASLMA
jgi:cytosine/adenosine deaminase-related metal-dependent hydrolase